MQENNKKIGFFKRMVYAIKDFEKYQEFALENKIIAVRYIMKLVLILVLVISICFMCRFAFVVKKGISYFRNEFPNLYFSNNELTVEADIPIIHEFSEEFSGIIIVDTVSVDEEKYYKDKLELYENGEKLRTPFEISTSDASLVRISNDGQLQFLKRGIVNITVSLKNGFSKTYQVKIRDRVVPPIVSSPAMNEQGEIVVKLEMSTAV